MSIRRELAPKEMGSTGSRQTRWVVLFVAGWLRWLCVGKAFSGSLCQKNKKKAALWLVNCSFGCLRPELVSSYRSLVYLLMIILSARHVTSGISIIDNRKKQQMVECNDSWVRVSLKPWNCREWDLSRRYCIWYPEGIITALDMHGSES